MSLLAKCSSQHLADHWAALGITPDFTWLRAPEIGGVMVRGRMGGNGAAFNMGEVTVTRCSLMLTDGGFVGHACVQGRGKIKAEQAALIDALMQTDSAPQIAQSVLTPLDDLMQQAATARAARAAATKVDFFTMVRGEDA